MILWCVERTQQADTDSTVVTGAQEGLDSLLAESSLIISGKRPMVGELILASRDE